MTELKVDALRVSYGGIHAVRAVNFQVAAGQVVALIGPNGAGKSSIANALMGLVRSEGGMSVGGRDIRRLSTERRADAGIGFVPEGRGIFMQLDVRENLELGGYRVGKKVRAQRMRDVTELFPVLGKRLSQQAGSLSGGEQQMLAMARALMIAPSVLICDEPSMGLSPAITRLVFGLLRTVADERKAAVLVGDQNALRAFEVADTVCVMRLGSIVASGSPADFGSARALSAKYFGHDESGHEESDAHEKE